MDPIKTIFRILFYLIIAYLSILGGIQVGNSVWMKACKFVKDVPLIGAGVHSCVDDSTIVNMSPEIKEHVNEIKETCQKQATYECKRAIDKARIECQNGQMSPWAGAEDAICQNPPDPENGRKVSMYYKIVVDDSIFLAYKKMKVWTPRPVANNGLLIARDLFAYLRNEVISDARGREMVQLEKDKIESYDAELRTLDDKLKDLPSCASTTATALMQKEMARKRRHLKRLEREKIRRRRGRRRMRKVKTSRR